MASTGSERAAVVQVDLPGRLIRITPDLKADGAPSAPDVLVVVAWCPGGRATAFTADDEALSELNSEVERLGRETLSAAVFDPAGAWHLAAVSVVGDGLDELGARLASYAKQDRYRLIDSHGITEVFRRTGFRRRTPARIQELAHRPCPILAEGKKAPCRDPGGPWGGRAIKASLQFRARRYSALRAVGCDDCNPARPPEGAAGTPIALRTVLDPAPRDRRLYGDGRNTTEVPW